jgi:hypothetical protein
MMVLAGVPSSHRCSHRAVLLEHSRVRSATSAATSSVREAEAAEFPGGELGGDDVAGVDRSAEDRVRVAGAPP